MRSVNEGQGVPVSLEGQGKKCQGIDPFWGEVMRSLCDFHV